MKRIRLSQNQLRWLKDLAAGVDPWERKHGGSQRGGSLQTQYSLFRHGFTSALGDLTDKGREYLKSQEPPAAPPTRPALKLTGVRYMGYATRVVDVHRRWNQRRAERAARDEPPAT